MTRPLNIAHCVEFYAPSVGGMQEVVKQLSERMVRAGHRVTVFTSHVPERAADTLNGVRIRSFPVKGNAAFGITGDPQPYLDALREGGFDVVTLFAAQQWTTDTLLPHLSSIPGAKVFVPTGFAALHDPRYAAYYAQMPAWLRTMDLNIFLSWSYQDMAFARAHGIERVTVVPNGAAEEEFDGPSAHDLRAELGIPAKAPLLLHVGGFTGAKGQHEALRMFYAARRTKGATLLLIGNGMERFASTLRGPRWMWARLKAQLTGRRAIFLSTDRARTVSAMRQADLFLFPSLVECSPIVLFETLAAGVPFLSSNAGNAAEIAEWSGAGWIMKGRRHPQGWEEVDVAAAAQQLDELLAHPEELRAKGQHGRAVWKERFTWRTIADQYLAHYQHLVAAREARTE